MSFKAMTWAASVKTPTSTQKLILLLLADRAGDADTCFPSLKKIAEDACVSRSCVIENIKKLAANGFIFVEKRTILNEESGRTGNTSNLYALNVGSYPLGSCNGSYMVVNENDHPSQRGRLGVVNEDDPNQSVESVKESSSLLANAEEVEKEVESSNKKPTAPEEKKASMVAPAALNLASRIVGSRRRLCPDAKNVNSDNVDKTRLAWAADIEKLERLDGHSWEEIGRVLEWALTDSFWEPNIQSGGKLRAKFDDLRIKMSHGEKQAKKPLTVEELFRD